jgi:hypothetical protein
VQFKLRASVFLAIAGKISAKSADKSSNKLNLDFLAHAMTIRYALRILRRHCLPQKLGADHATFGGIALPLVFGLHGS